MVDESVTAVATRMERAPDHKELYCNVTRTRISPWDISIIFCQGKTRPNGQPYIEEQATVVMSPPLFKTLVHAVQKCMEGYESQFGEVFFRKELLGPDPAGQFADLVEAIKKAQGDNEQQAG